MSDDSSPSLALRLFSRLVLNTALVWGLASYAPDTFLLGGGIRAIFIVGLILTALNAVLRPVLDVVTLPLKLVAGIIAIVLVNGVLVWVVLRIAERLGPDLLTLTIGGGIGGWITVALVFGLGNFLIRLILK